MQPVPRSFQAHRPVLDEAWPAQPPGSPRDDQKQNFRLPLELEILTNRRCARVILRFLPSVMSPIFRIKAGNRYRGLPHSRCSRENARLGTLLLEPLGALRKRSSIGTKGAWPRSVETRQSPILR